MKTITLHRFGIRARDGRIDADSIGKELIFEYDDCRKYIVYRHKTVSGTLDIDDENLENLCVDFTFASSKSVNGSVYIEENRIKHKDRIISRAIEEMRRKCREHFGRW